MKYFMLFCLMLLFTSCREHSTPKESNGKILFYHEHLQEARKLAQEKDYRATAAKYTDAFLDYPSNIQYRDRVDAAFYWTLAGETDSAFFYLKPVVEDTDYIQVKITDLIKDRRLIPLMKYAQWDTIIAGLEKNRMRKFPHLNVRLADQLDEIRYKDQFYRLQIDDIYARYSRNSPEMKKFIRNWENQDSVNMKKIIAIIDQYGWLGEDEVGYDGNSALFLVIQHADSATQRKYLPIMREAVKQGKSSGSKLALLEDRVALGQGKRQIYGSQIGHDPILMRSMVLPLEDPEHVDKRRASVGLQSLKGYVMMWDIEWDAKKYKAYLPYYERNMKLIEKMIDSLVVLKEKHK